MLTSMDINGFSVLGSIKVTNTTNLRLIAALEDYADRDKLHYCVSTMLVKEFEVSAKNHIKK